MIWRGVKTSISRAGTDLNAVGLSPRFAWTLQLQFWRSTAPPKRDSRSTTVFQLHRNPRLELERPENINPPGRSRSTFRQPTQKKSLYRTNPSDPLVERYS